MATLAFRLPDGTYDPIEFDVTLSERTTLGARVTEHAVEAGANIADHVTPANDVIEFEVVVTNTPISQPGTHTGGAVGSVGETALDLAGALGSASVLTWDAGFDRVRAVYDDLRFAIREGLEVRIAGEHFDYDRAILESVDAPRDAKTGDAIKIRCVAREIRTATTEVVAIEPLVRRARSTRNRGHQATEEPTPATSAASDSASQSLAYQTATGIGRALAGAD